MNSSQHDLSTVIIMLVIHSLFQGLFVLLAAKILKIENRNYKKAFLSALFTDICGGLLYWIFGSIPYFGAMISFIGGVIVALITIRLLFKVDIRRTFLTVVISFGLNIILTFLVTILAFIAWNMRIPGE